MTAATNQALYKHGNLKNILLNTGLAIIISSNLLQCTASSAADYSGMSEQQNEIAPTLDSTSMRTTVFAENFNSTVPSEFSGTTTTEGIQGYNGIGIGSNVFGGKFLRNTATGNPASKTTLTLTGLPPHSIVSIRFLLATIDSWDGDSPPMW